MIQPCIIHLIRGIVPAISCGKINVIMTLTFDPLSLSHNVTAFQHRFNTESLILLHLIYTFIILNHMTFYSTVLAIATI